MVLAQPNPSLSYFYPVVEFQLVSTRDSPMSRVLTSTFRLSRVPVLRRWCMCHEYFFAECIRCHECKFSTEHSTGISLILIIDVYCVIWKCSKFQLCEHLAAVSVRGFARMRPRPHQRTYNSMGGCNMYWNSLYKWWRRARARA